MSLEMVSVFRRFSCSSDRLTFTVECEVDVFSQNAMTAASARVSWFSEWWYVKSL